MSVISYHEQEYTCEHTFSSLGPIYHIYSPENYKTFLFTEEDFIEAMNIFGIICGLYRKKVRVITFEFVNHPLAED